MANEQTDKLLDKLLNISNILDYIREIIRKKAVGNPLFVEEMIRFFIDTNINMSDDVWHTLRNGRGIILDCNYSLALADGYFIKGDKEKALSNAKEAFQIAMKQEPIENWVK